MDRFHVGLEEGPTDCAVPDPDVGEVVWRGKHQDEVREYLGGPCLVDGGTSEVGLLLGELGFS